MTPEDLERLVALGDSKKLAAAVAKLSGPQRKKLAKTAQALRRDIVEARRSPGETRYQSLERLRVYLGKRKVDIVPQAATAHLALLAVGSLNQAKQVLADWRSDIHKNDDAAMLKVLRDRRPKWVDNWFAEALANNSGSIEWELLWPLISEGICQKPKHDSYYRWFASCLSRDNLRHRGRKTSLNKLLASEPILLNDIWRLFELGSAAFSYGWGNERDGNEEPWPRAVLKLAENGVIDRERVLDATLAAQSSELHLHVLSTLAKLHERLEPTADELAARQTICCDLMSARSGQVVTFAVKMLKKLEQAKRLDDAAFVPAARAVFNVPTKGPPKSVIGLLKKIVKRDSQLVSPASRALIEALNHPEAEVQAAALDTLTTIASQLDTDALKQIAERLDELPATVRPRAAELVVSKAGTEVDAVPDVKLTGAAKKRLAHQRKRAAAIDRRWREMAGVDDALAAVEESGWAAPLEFDPLKTPVLSSLEAVQPIESLEELIDAVAHGIEHADSAIEVERILDGMSRLCGQRTDDFDRRVAPLVQRVKKVKETFRSSGIASQYTAPRPLTRVLGTWLAGNADLSKPDGGGGMGQTPTTKFIQLRLEALQKQIAAGQSLPLLAAPTHQRGWIAPEALVDRWLELEQRGCPPQQVDIVQALLRMAPDGRASALEQSASLKDPSARALRWALGGDDGPRKKDAKNADIWLAAGRARSTVDELKQLAVAGIADTGPDTIQPAAYKWRAKIQNGKGWRKAELDLHAYPRAKKQLDQNLLRPTVLTHLPLWDEHPYDTDAVWVYQWVGMIWPAKLDGHFATATRCMVKRFDEPGATSMPNHAFMPPLFDADRPWSDVARLMAIVGAACRDQDVRGLAVDALVEAITDGRVHPETLGGTLSTLTTPYWLKLNRLCDNLAEVARVSPLHAWTIMVTTQRLLVAYDELPQDAHYLLALLQELQAQLGLPLPEAVIERLRAAKGSSKTTKLAKALCPLAPAQPNPACDEARLMTLEARLNRAKRWANG